MQERNKYTFKLIQDYKKDKDLNMFSININTIMLILFYLFLSKMVYFI